MSEFDDILRFDYNNIDKRISVTFSLAADIELEEMDDMIMDYAEETLKEVMFRKLQDVILTKYNDMCRYNIAIDGNIDNCCGAGVYEIDIGEKTLKLHPMLSISNDWLICSYKTMGELMMMKHRCSYRTHPCTTSLPFFNKTKEIEKY